MNLLTWLGLVSVSKHQKLERQHRELQDAYDQIRKEADDLRRQLDRAETVIGAERASRAEVTKMLRQAMDDVTSAVGLAQILDAAKLKLETVAETSTSNEPKRLPLTRPSSRDTVN